MEMHNKHNDEQWSESKKYAELKALYIYFVFFFLLSNKRDIKVKHAQKKKTKRNLQNSYTSLKALKQWKAYIEVPRNFFFIKYVYNNFV